MPTVIVKAKITVSKKNTKRPNACGIAMPDGASMPTIVNGRNSAARIKLKSGIRIDPGHSAEAEVLVMVLESDVKFFTPKATFVLANGPNVVWGLCEVLELLEIVPDMPRL